MDSVILMLRNEKDRNQIVKKLIQDRNENTGLTWPCNYLKGVLNYHIHNQASREMDEHFVEPTFVVTGGATFVRGSAMAVRTVFGQIHCAADLGETKHCFDYRGEDMGWGLNFMRAGHVPYVLVEHLVKHLAGGKDPTALVPGKKAWPVDLRGKRLALPLTQCGASAASPAN